MRGKQPQRKELKQAAGERVDAGAPGLAGTEIRHTGMRWRSPQPMRARGGCASAAFARSGLHGRPACDGLRVHSCFRICRLSAALVRLRSTVCRPRALDPRSRGRATARARGGRGRACCTACFSALTDCNAAEAHLWPLGGDGRRENAAGPRVVGTSRSKVPPGPNDQSRRQAPQAESLEAASGDVLFHPCARKQSICASAHVSASGRSLAQEEPYPSAQTTAGLASN